MYNTAMIPLESVLKDVYLVAENHQIDEDLINEFAVRALEHIAVYKTYDFAVCILKVENNQAMFPRGMLGVEHLLYMAETVNQRQRRFILDETIMNIKEVNWNVIEYDVRYDAKLTNFVGIGSTLIHQGWQYLPLSDRNANRSIICNPELMLNDSCGDWWYPDIAKGRFITSFESGYIAVTYFRYPQNEEGQYMILDKPFIKDAIFNYVMSMLYMKFWLQGEKDAQQKHDYFNRKWGILANAAIAEASKLSFDEVINLDKINTLFKKDDIKKIIGGYGKEIKNMM